jgi:acyl-CoA synthetase (AMP-forming)/AMP-acid ligase II
MNISEWLLQAARVSPDAPAIRCGLDLHATYGQFAARSASMATYLSESLGIRKGDRVALFMQNCPEYLEILHAVLWMGAIVVPINYKLHPREAAWIIDDAKARVVVTQTGTVFASGIELAETCNELGTHDPALTAAAQSSAEITPPVGTGKDDVAWLFYTSGTTGRPKGVMTTHGNLIAMSLAYAMDVDSPTARDNSLYAAPMSHGAGLYHFPIIRAGGCHVIPQSGGFDPAEIAELAQALDNLVFFAAPTMIKRQIAHARATGYDGAGIKTIIYGGGPMYLADIEEGLAVFGARFVQIYGQGECPMTITVLPRDLVADTAHPNADARRGSVGSGDALMKGYWGNEKATADTVVDGWLRTGDLGSMDADGFLTLTDRSKDVIISGGTNIYPREVEETLLAHENVSEVSVIGVPSPEWGEDVVAFVVATGDGPCDAPQLDAWCKSRMASFKKPKTYHFVQDLPKNSYGKVLKTSLRERIAQELEGEHQA